MFENSIVLCILRLKAIWLGKLIKPGNMNLSVHLDNASLVIFRSIRLDCWPTTAAAAHPSKSRNRSFHRAQKTKAHNNPGNISQKYVLVPGFRLSEHPELMR